VPASEVNRQPLRRVQTPAEVHVLGELVRVRVELMDVCSSFDPGIR
jgi:hypothetical protein